MISFFAKPVYTKRDSHGNLYLQRISSIVRGKQIAEYLGARFNPDIPEGTEVHIKPRKLEILKSGAYVDILDDLKLTDKMSSRPDLNVLAMSGPHYSWIESFLPNSIVMIPHCHFNHDRLQRDRKEITTCGYIGAWNSYHEKINNEVKRALKGAGFNFVSCFNFLTRKDNIEFYKNIDIQVIGYFDFHMNAPHYHPTKIVNAMSFGIPTVAGPKLGYKDVDGYYLPVNDMEELVDAVIRLKEPEEYNLWKERGLNEAEKYHISNISKLYLEL